uniref:CAP-Gly domain-containing linker protein 3 n=1 Tax=Myxine glutinosa TaxID=7769 RepID=UPI00358F0573
MTKDAASEENRENVKDPDKAKPTRPVSHPVSVAPLPPDYGFAFFDPSDPGCQEILFDPATTISQLFAIVRQWVPQVQQKIDVIGNEILKRGCKTNDRDGLTDMTLLHYACKAGAHGVGSVVAAMTLTSQLLELGANPSLRCRWTGMNALHYAAYFDTPDLIRTIMKASKIQDVDAACSDVEFGSSLHIAASNLCMGAVKSLLEHGANPAFKNSRGQIPAEVVPEPSDMPLDGTESAAVAHDVRQLLLEAVPLACRFPRATLPNYDNLPGHVLLVSLGMRLGDRVVLPEDKIGNLRFCGPTAFASGQWAGVELDEAEGKNDGCVGGVQYFNCAPKHGLFAPVSKLQKISQGGLSLPTSPANGPHKSSRSHLGPRLYKGLKQWSPATSRKHQELKIGERVIVAGLKKGIVQFCGKTEFAPGRWYGVALDNPEGKHDGMVKGTRYFTCPPRHGVFAPPSRVKRAVESVEPSPRILCSMLGAPFLGDKQGIGDCSNLSMKEISTKHPVSRLLFCCWFPWMVKGKPQP